MDINKDENKIDIRIIQLGKWHVPRTKRIKETKNDEYLSVGHFDMIRVLEGKQSEKKHLFFNAYKNMLRQNKFSVSNTDIMEDYSIQEIVGYTNVGMDGSEEKKRLEEFWGDKSSLLFVSLIHVNNDSNISSIVNEIKNKFKEKKYVYYFSLDYSGIILMFKGNKVHEFLSLLFELNYTADENGKKIIRDSYSFYGFEKNWLVGCFAQFREAEAEKKDAYESVEIYKEYEETFSAAVNIGVQNYKTYQWLKEMLPQKDSIITTYGMLGRHDISIVNDKANLKWLVYMQYILDELVGKGNKSKFDTLFSVYETFVKIPGMKEYVDATPGEEEKAYQKVKKELDILCDDFSDVLQGGPYNGEYIRPVREVKYSLLSILRNRYAENFVLCIYAPFRGFLKYMIDKMAEEKSVKKFRSSEFDKSYKAFFSCLNSLVNSAMHSERQFVQATAFNAVIYDIPSRLLAFYMAIIREVKDIMKGDGEAEYTFILTPSFSNEIRVEIISYIEENSMPHDRILKVEISEKSLYNPPEVERVLVHEISHFLGDKLRMREKRADRLRFSIIYLILAQIIAKDLWEPDIDAFVDDISDYLKKVRGFGEDCLYSRDLMLLGIKVVEEFQNNAVIETKLVNYITELLKNNNEIRQTGYIKDLMKKNLGVASCIVDEKILARMIMAEMKESLDYLAIERYSRFERNGHTDQSLIRMDVAKNLNVVPIGYATKVLVRMYCEAYADIQKVLVTGIGYQEYLLGFLGEEEDTWEFPIDGNLEDIGRISMVSLTMKKCGLWECKQTKQMDGTMTRKFVRLHKAVTNVIIEVDSIYQNKGLKVVEQFKEDYSSYIQSMKYKPDDEKSEMIEDCESKERENVQKGISITPTSIMYFELFRYLFNCTREIVKKYSQGDLCERIDKLRTTMKTVNKCADIQEVFEVMNESITDYRRKIFPEAVKVKEEGKAEQK